MLKLKVSIDAEMKELWFFFFFNFQLGSSQKMNLGVSQTADSLWMSHLFTVISGVDRGPSKRKMTQSAAAVGRKTSCLWPRSEIRLGKLVGEHRSSNRHSAKQRLSIQNWHSVAEKAGDYRIYY